MKRIISVCFFALVFTLVLIPAACSNAEYISGQTTKVDYDNTDPNKYTIDIDLTNQIITVTDNYQSKIVKRTLCTTGSEKTPTGAGTFKLGELKERFGYFVAYGQYAQYWSQIVRGIYIHSVMYSSKNTSTMVRSAYNNLGTALSHGCVRTTPDMAQFIFYKYVQPKDSKSDPLELPAVVNTNNAPLRTGSSSVNDTTIGYLNANTKCVLLQISPTWCKIRTISGEIGYIKTQYLLFDADNYDITATVYTSRTTLPVYARASASSRLKGTVPKTTVVEYIAPYNDDWCIIGYNYGEDYIFGHVELDDLKLTKVINYPKLDDYDDSTANNNYQILYVRDGIIANMRLGDSTDDPVITQLKGGTELRVISHSGNWYYCQAGAFTGYLHKTCIFN